MIKEINFIILWLLEQIQQDNANENKSVATICNEVFPLSRYSMFCFFMPSLSAINHVLIYILIIFESKEFILSELIILLTFCLQFYVRCFCSFLNYIYEQYVI